MSKRRGRLVGAAVAALPLVMPQPAQQPKFHVDPKFMDAAAKNDVADHVVTSGVKLDRFARKHEKFHTLDADQFTDLDRGALRVLLDLDRDGDWMGFADDAEDAIPPAEVAADYYAYAQAPKTRRRKDGALIHQDSSSYVTPGRKKMQRFRVFMDGWAQRQGLGAKQPSSVDELVEQTLARYRQRQD